MRLDYTGPPGCSDPEPFVLGLTPRVSGWDPLATTATWRLVITIKLRKGYEGGAVLYDPRGGVAWTLKYAPQRTCGGLLEMMAFAVAFRIDPPDAPPPAPVPACAPAPVAPAPPAPECPKSPPDEPLEPLPPPLGPPFITRMPPEKKTVPIFRIGAAAWASQVTTDRGAFGLSLDAGVRYGWFSAAVEGRWDPPLGPTLFHMFGSLDYTRVTGALLMCSQFEWVFGCAKGELGSILFSGTIRPGPPQMYAAAGIRLGVDFPVASPRLFLRVAGDVLETIDPAIIARGTDSLFQVTRTNMGLGLGVLWALDK